MSREFIEIPLFTKRWSEIGLEDAELNELQLLLLKDPESGPVMEGTEEKAVLKKLVKSLKEAERQRRNM